ncbi:MAG: hypothetical protein J0H51_18885 [Rhizobiales bacterium]|nr:hypothetical protein [Hyphomicrobiales bacterium]
MPHNAHVVQSNCHNAAVYIQPSAANRKPTRKKIGSNTGTLIDPFRRREIYYESNLERDHILVWIANPDVLEIQEQYRVEYLCNGAVKEHFVDVLVTFKDGSRFAYFIKYDRQLYSSGIRGQIQAIVAGCSDDFADELRILTENHVDEMAISNAKLIVNAGRQFDEDATCIVRAALSSAPAVVTPRQIGRDTGLGRRGEDAFIALLQSGAVSISQNRQITADAPFNNLLTPVTT